MSIKGDNNFRGKLAKGILSTGMIAQLLGIAPRTVCKWIDLGKLKAFRLPYAGNRTDTQHLLGDRRVFLADLLEFIKVNSVPMPPPLVEMLSPDVVIAYGVTIPVATGWPDATYIEMNNPFSLGEYVGTVVKGKLRAFIVTDLDGYFHATSAIDLILSKHPECMVFFGVDMSVALNNTNPKIKQFHTPIDWKAIQCDISVITHKGFTDPTQFLRVLPLNSSA